MVTDCSSNAVQWQETVRGRAADLGPVVSDVHGERFEGLHILVRFHLQFTFLAGLCNVARCLLQLT